MKNNVSIDVGRVVAPAPRDAAGGGIGPALQTIIAERGLPPGATARATDRLVVDAPRQGMTEHEIAAAIYDAMFGGRGGR